MTLQLRDGVSAADTEYGITLLDEDSGQYWNLNPTAALACSKVAGLAPRRSRPSTVRIRRGDRVASSRAAPTAREVTIRRGRGTARGW